MSAIKTQSQRHRPLAQSILLACLLVSLGAALGACASKDDGDPGANTGGPTRAFLMGSTPFYATPSAFPAWRFDELADKDLVSVHVDDFWGVPWVEFRDNTALPTAWVNKWATLAADARATGKTLYLAASPLGGRITLAPRVLADGSTQANWAPIEANGCYPFASEADASAYKTAYINYLSYLINLVQPKYFSPAIEIDIPFTKCPAQKTAWVAWYSEVHNAIKAAFPTLVVFPTFQMEHMYGIADAQAACGSGVGVAECFGLRLTEALAIPGERIAFSTYPISWEYHPEYSFSYPTDTYARVQAATTRKIWVSETGWAAVKIRDSYPHSGLGSCGTVLFPNSSNDTEQGRYLTWLLSEAQSRKMETVIWWLGRDYLDAAVAATCPCAPTSSETCQLTDIFHATGGPTGELLLRLFGNMALRDYNGSARPAQTTWQDYFKRDWKPAD